MIVPFHSCSRPHSPRVPMFVALFALFEQNTASITRLLQLETNERSGPSQGFWTYLRHRYPIWAADYSIYNAVGAGQKKRLGSCSLALASTSLFEFALRRFRQLHRLVFAEQLERFLQLNIFHCGFRSLRNNLGLVGRLTRLYCRVVIVPR